MTPKSPAEVLFGAYHRRILALLLLRPEQSFHVREIARLAGVPAGSLHRELKLLAESGLLLREPAGNQVLYRANRDCPVFSELAGFIRKTNRLERLGGACVQEGDAMMHSDDLLVIGQTLKVSRAALQELVRRYHIRRLALFGSAARDELKPDSDIDLMVEFEPGAAPSLWAAQDLQQDFVRLFDGRQVDIAPPEILRNPYRRKTIERDLKVLYEAA